MTQLLDVSFPYGVQQKGLTVERTNIEKPLILRKLVTWTFKDKLNEILTLKIALNKKDLDLDNIYLERNINIPAFGIKGIITGITDMEDTQLVLQIHDESWHFTRRLYKIADSFKEYKIKWTSNNTVTDVLDDLITSANTDMPFTWTKGEDSDDSTTEFEFDIKWKTYFDVLKTLALNTLKDLWFENKKVYLGKKGKSIILDKSDTLYGKLVSKIDLDAYANIVNIVGAKEKTVNNEKTNFYTTRSDTNTELTYNYEKSISNNTLKTQDATDEAAARVLTEFNNINPDVTIDVTEEIINKYDMKSGDILKIASTTETQKVKGFFRIIELNMSNTKNSLKLQYNKNGKFLPRASDTLDMLKTLVQKIHEIELNS